MADGAEERMTSFRLFRRAARAPVVVENRATMNDTAEPTATRLWRDRAQLREQERNEAQAQARIAEERAASLTAENARLAAENEQLRAFNNQLAAENAQLRALLNPDPACAHAQIEQEMEDLKGELLSLLAQPNEKQA